MFLFRFVRHLRFLKDERWLEAYDRLCRETDFLYLRELEISSMKKTAIAIFVMDVCFAWLLFHPTFRTFSFVLIAVLFFLVSALYLLTEFTYVPLEIEKTRIYAKEAKMRKPSSVVSKPIKTYRFETSHPYFVYTTESRKKATDMTDRILGEDQGYEEEEVVYCFSAMNDNQYYVLPVINNNNPQGENDNDEEPE